MKKTRKWATTAGLVVALFGLPCLALVQRSTIGLHVTILPVALEWALLGVLWAIMVFGESAGLTSIGGSPRRWWFVPAGFAIGIALIVLLVATLMLVQLAGFSIAQSTAAMARLVRQPFWLRALVVLTAAVVEETFYRGYAIERLGAALGNYPLAGFIALVAFSLAHAVFWGWIQVIPVFVVGAALSVLYVWRRSLLLTIIAHLTTDGIPLLVLPLLHR